jgi:hypothetical protein
MSLATKTAVATVLRRYHEGFYTRSEAYHLISNIYYEEHKHA